MVIGFVYLAAGVQERISRQGRWGRSFAPSYQIGYEEFKPFR